MNQEQSISTFAENYHGVLTHDGSVQVAKSKIKAKILFIDIDSVLVKSRNNTKSYVAKIHKDLYPMMKFCDAGDTGNIKFRKGQAWLVGYQKASAEKLTYNETGDKPVTSNTDWIGLYDLMEWGE